MASSHTMPGESVFFPATRPIRRQCSAERCVCIKPLASHHSLRVCISRSWAKLTWHSLFTCTRISSIYCCESVGWWHFQMFNLLLSLDPHRLFLAGEGFKNPSLGKILFLDMPEFWEFLLCPPSLIPCYCIFWAFASLFKLESVLVSDKMALTIQFICSVNLCPCPTDDLLFHFFYNSNLSLVYAMTTAKTL